MDFILLVLVVYVIMLYFLDSTNIIFKFSL